MGMTDEYDVIIKNGLIVDGTTAPPHSAALGVRAGKITAIGDVKGERAPWAFGGVRERAFL